MCRRVEARAQTHMKNYKRKHLSSNPPRPPNPKARWTPQNRSKQQRGGSQLHQKHRAKKPKLQKNTKERGNKRNPNPETQKKKKITKCKANNKIFKNSSKDQQQQRRRREMLGQGKVADEGAEDDNEVPAILKTLKLATLKLRSD